MVWLSPPFVCSHFLFPSLEKYLFFFCPSSPTSCSWGIGVCIEQFAQVLPWSKREKGPGERGTDEEGEVRTGLGTVSSVVSLACRDAVCPLPLSPEQSR